VLLTGAYPAYLLSGFRAVQVLSGKTGVPGRGILGRALIVVQFSIAVFLLVITLFFYRQMEYIRTKDLGYDPHQVVVTHISGDRSLQQVQDVFKHELSGEPGIRDIAFGGERSGVSAVKLGEKQVDAVHRVIDGHYLPALGISLKEGRNFSDAYPTDKTNGVIVNEAFVKAAGLKDPIGARLRTDEYFDKEGKTIIGVIKDFHAGSLRERVQPMVMMMSNWFGGTVWLKVEKSRQQQALSALTAAYRKALPETAFSYTFLDELNAKEYEQELRWKKIIYIATVLSVLICCSGLFGLVHIATHQRIREIGIRKILGAGMSSIITLFSKDFLRLVLLAIIITCPVAWGVIHHWLQNFAYHVEINAWVFMMAGAFALLIAFGTVVFQVARTVWANPVNNLRTV
jgi:putative ABC transport system permease protein